MLPSFRPSRPLPAVSGLCLAAWLAACGSPEAEPGSCRDCNVVLLLADTLRADHLGSYGYPRTTSPFLDRFAASAVRFPKARSQSACTFPSVNSLLTSRHVFDFLAAETRPAIPEGIPSLAELLAAQGYATAAVSASPIVRVTPSEHNPMGGFGRGFERFDERCLWREAGCVTARAIEAIEGMEPPFFLYAHYMDPHDPYRAPAELRGVFAGAYEGRHPFIAEGDPNPIEGWIRDGRAREELSAGDLAHLVDLYDEEVAALDVGLRRLVGHLERRGLLGETIVVVASDHGESFFEHGTVKHCYTVYDSETRVPLILHLPGAAMPAEPAGWAQNLDLVPTILDYLGVEAPADLAGSSLRPLIEGRGPAERRAWSAMATYRSLDEGRFKLVHELRSGGYELFDLAGDPDESRDLSERETERFEALRRRLETWMEEVEGGDREERLRRAEEIEAELRALGYLG